jgi:DnaK suppressor protein
LANRVLNTLRRKKLEWIMNTTITSINAGTKRRQMALETKLNELVKLQGDRESLEIQTMADPLDQVRLSTDRDMAVETLNQQARSIHDIRAALARIKDGSYGQCERCEEPIPIKRLDALPWARLCVTCQSAVEVESHGPDAVFDSAA